MKLAQQYIAFRTILTKEILRFARIWVQTVVPPAITTTLYFVIFGNLIGSRIGKMDGYAYIDYIVPGLILMAVITNAYSNVVSSFYSAKFQKHVEEMLISPTPNGIILAGYIAGGVARGVCVGIVVTIISMFFTDLKIENWGISFLVVVLTATLFAAAGFINAVYAKSFDDISIIPTFVLTPLTYLGGIFYTIKMLPEFWQTASLANPILYMINAFRYGILGASDIDIGLAFSIILIFIVLLIAWSMQLLNKGVGLRN
ncbi:MAG: ABC transporter permease [Gammaproteobacteria bacterium]|nr:ABC transporter permease [Gammaproteobacteria bacterium]MDH5728455.1 ABC transporter permease [Gammaproteobacteria bacterium]